MDADTTRRLNQIVVGYNRDRSAVIAILQDIQAEFRYLSEEALKYLSQSLDIPIAKIYSLASFYRAFSLEPRGKHLIHVCLGTACHVRGAVRILGTIERTLGLQAGETDANLEFTLETVNCLGACALGPVVVVNGEYHGQITSAKATRLLKRLRKSDENQTRQDREPR
ncbi:MAG: NAD(P)H-dependent oxidoreductase subunit E [Anaerolineae bacterium]|nr:NAD(P)H-dependent oxidoreductase subunit E [Anaerolineae bacterium]